MLIETLVTHMSVGLCLLMLVHILSFQLMLLMAPIGRTFGDIFAPLSLMIGFLLVMFTATLTRGQMGMPIATIEIILGLACAFMTLLITRVLNVSLTERNLIR